MDLNYPVGRFSIRVIGVVHEIVLSHESGHSMYPDDFCYSPLMHSRPTYGNQGE